MEGSKKPTGHWDSCCSHPGLRRGAWAGGTTTETSGDELIWDIFWRQVFRLNDQLDERQQEIAIYQLRGCVCVWCPHTDEGQALQAELETYRSYKSVSNSLPSYSLTASKNTGMAAQACLCRRLGGDPQGCLLICGEPKWLRSEPRVTCRKQARKHWETPYACCRL